MKMKIQTCKIHTMKKIILILFGLSICLRTFSQQKWDVGGNVISTGNFIGTNNNEPFILKANGNEGIRIKTDGGVRIIPLVTTSNVNGLVITNQSGLLSRLDFNGTGTQVLFDNGAWGSLPTYNNPWQISGSNINYNNGNVGIGTSNPQALLDVAGKSIFEADVNINGIFKVWTPSSPTILEVSSSQQVRLGGFQGTSGKFAVANPDGFPNSAEFYSGTGGTPALQVTNSRKVEVDGDGAGFSGAKPATQSAAFAVRGNIATEGTNTSISMSGNFNSVLYMQETNNAQANKRAFSIIVDGSANGGVPAILRFASHTDDWTSTVNPDILTMTHDGKVGIGNNNPQYALDVTGGAKISTLGGANNSLVLANQTGVLSSLTPGTNSQVLYGNGLWGDLPVQLWTTNGNTTSIQASYSVGIGTTTPQASFDVAGKSVFESDMNIQGTLKLGMHSLYLAGNNSGNLNQIYTDNGPLSINGPGTTNQNTEINEVGGLTMVGMNSSSVFNNSSQDPKFHFMAKDFMKLVGQEPSINFGTNTNATTNYNGDMAIEYFDAPGNPTGLNFWKPFPNTNGFDNFLLFVGSNGNVGVGTGTPSAKLHVNGTINAGADIINNWTNSTSTAYPQATANGYWNVPLIIPNGSAIRTATKAATGGIQRYLGFGMNDGLVSGWFWMVEGTNDINSQACYPMSLILDGNGNATLTISQSGWCDFVFEKGYKGMSILEKEKYYNQNKHLPGIDAASVVKKTD